MFDLLGPVRKLLTVSLVIAAFVAANAALLYALSACVTSAACVGTSGAATIIPEMKAIAGLFLPGNFYACVQAMLLAMIMRRAYDYGVKLLSMTSAAT